MFAGMKRAGVRVLAGSDLIILAFTGADNGGRGADNLETVSNTETRELM